MKPTKTWIIIANSESAKVIENSGPNKGMFQLKDMTFQAVDVKQYSDRQGRSFASASTERHKLEKHHGVDAASWQHIDELISSLQKADNTKAFDRLIVCAPPEILSILRRQMPKQLNSKVFSELNKNLANINLADLASHFDDILVL